MEVRDDFQSVLGFEDQVVFDGSTKAAVRALFASFDVLRLTRLCLESGRQSRNLWTVLQ
eukprot:Cvel_35591.t1-p1 / transcript=Cvel_35591.t1 / gene=Cvel_35591 / organism=Chromera_velia_CCMP2878 / gene_product=hypothetical protein / transcript_product=hypothetical protein / location=Cvel_scaffold6570:297-708(-) / protein_length=58 / sequence_SO=supercontig / SO=protein_coding / is_pseudo=false